MRDISLFFNRLNFKEKYAKDIHYLVALHKAHFYSVPFENFTMKDNGAGELSYDDIAHKVIFSNRGGICFEFMVLLEKLFDHLGYVHCSRLAKVLIPFMTPATHQLSIVSINEERWIFDVGFGAKGPRAPLLLIDGYIHEHIFLSSKVTRNSVHGWVVSVKENSKPNAVWEDIYSFHDTATFQPDINMAYFYTLHSPQSLLNTNQVASLPTENGRISIRNNTFTEVNGFSSLSVEIADKQALSQLLSERFGIALSPENIPEEGIQ
ncbi:arylamine N-acetyltransferase family protein [Ewingella americana]|uniref:Arylamine N-acetyltransferase n=1 Tax=Ewingella americana TaxID=41202 RepID=A0A502G4S1_9GAMM|nr:arylamine N-acetyltransferase [Ewingella americana]TPG56774.1 arylamine N-acetyltransferase [Ewingella americana]